MVHFSGAAPLKNYPSLSYVPNEFRDTRKAAAGRSVLRENRSKLRFEPLKKCVPAVRRIGEHRQLQFDDELRSLAVPEPTCLHGSRGKKRRVFSFVFFPFNSEVQPFPPFLFSLRSPLSGIPNGLKQVFFSI